MLTQILSRCTDRTTHNMTYGLYENKKILKRSFKTLQKRSIFPSCCTLKMFRCLSNDTAYFNAGWSRKMGLGGGGERRYRNEIKLRALIFQMEFL